jgi:hypothetical protein
MRLQPARITAVISLATLGALAAVPAASHHSVRDAFDADSPIRVTGTVTAIEWVNPHMLFRLEVVDAAGDSAVWTLEMPAPSALKRRGIETGLLTVGDRITVEGWPALDGSRRADTRVIEFADGGRIDIPESRWMSIDDPSVSDGSLPIAPGGAPIAPVPPQ